MWILRKARIRVREAWRIKPLNGKERESIVALSLGRLRWERLESGGGW